MTGRRAGAEFPIKYTSVTVSTVVHLTQIQCRLKTAMNPHCDQSERLGVSNVPLPSTVPLENAWVACRTKSCLL